MKNATITRAENYFTNDPYNYTLKFCANCDADYSASDFVASYDEESFKTYCLACFMVGNKLNTRDFSKSLKVLVGCESCGYSRNSFALQYDHTNHAEKYRTKSGKIIHPSDLFRTCSISIFVAEVAKCAIRCANCHAEKTAKERGL